jgi:hypothetical protein
MREADEGHDCHPSPVVDAEGGGEGGRDMLLKGFLEAGKVGDIVVRVGQGWP